jgi:hypothetical protein
MFVSRIKRCGIHLREPSPRKRGRDAHERFPEGESRTNARAQQPIHERGDARIGSERGQKVMRENRSRIEDACTTKARFVAFHRYDDREGQHSGHANERDARRPRGEHVRERLRASASRARSDRTDRGYQCCGKHPGGKQRFMMRIDQAARREVRDRFGHGVTDDRRAQRDGGSDHHDVRKAPH